MLHPILRFLIASRAASSLQIGEIDFFCPSLPLIVPRCPGVTEVVSQFCEALYFQEASMKKWCATWQVLSWCTWRILETEDPSLDHLRSCSCYTSTAEGFIASNEAPMAQSRRSNFRNFLSAQIAIDRPPGRRKRWFEKRSLPEAS